MPGGQSLESPETKDRTKHDWKKMKEGRKGRVGEREREREFLMIPCCTCRPEST